MLKNITEILKTYKKTNSAFERLKDKAFLRRNPNAIQQIEDQQKINNQAYFILCWGQVEKMIDRACSIKVFGGQISRLGFKSRAKLVLGSQNSSALQFVLDCYSLRNSIAHGDLQTERIDVAKAISRLCTIFEDW
jgi:hypothetical protein